MSKELLQLQMDKVIMQELIYQDSKISINDPSITNLNSVSYPVQSASGIFKDYIGGNVTIDYSMPKRQIWLFKP